MAREYKLEIEKRQADVKLKNLRKEGVIPGVYYSHDSKESILFQMQLSELRLHIPKNPMHPLFQFPESAQ